MSKLLARRGLRKALQIQHKSGLALEVSPDLLASYEVLPDILGQGTTAVVKRGRRKAPPYGEVAIKVGNTCTDEERCRLAQQEFELLKSLKHPGIVEVYDFFVAPSMSKSYLVMELVCGHTLQALVGKHGPMKERAVQPLFKQLASVICYLHRKRVIHRDLKPDNLLIDAGLERLCIGDFNSAKSLVDSEGLTPRVGTLVYNAPETLLGKCFSGEKADIWAAGLCLFFALSGNAPFACTSFTSPTALGKHLTAVSLSDRCKWIKSLGVCVDSSVSQCLLGCLNPDPEQRLDSMLLLAHPWVSCISSASQDSSTMASCADLPIPKRRSASCSDLPIPKRRPTWQGRVRSQTDSHDDWMSELVEVVAAL